MDINSENDKRVAKLEKKLRAVYLQAQSDVQAKMEDYLQRFAVKDAIKQEQVKQGKISQEEYIKWREGQIAVGKLWQDKVDSLAADYTNANQIAVSMICGEMSGVFAENHNYAAYEIEHDTMLNLSFSLYDKNTLMNMVVNDPNMLPLPSVNIPKDLRWNKQKINSVIIQAILQGDSIPKIAQSLRKVSDMNYKAAVRNARTSMTAAQNAGRVESYKHAQDMGIDLQQEWLATLDGRTRHSHRQMDGERIAVAKDKWHPAKFSNGCRYPGDPQGPPWEIYNCRCTLVAAIKGIDQSDAPRNSKLGDMSYEEWKNGHKAQPTQTAPKSDNPFSPDAYTTERKTNALRFDKSQREEADKLLRPDTGKTWIQASMATRRAAYNYTGGSDEFNRPLRGYNNSWSNFVGVGKVDLNNEGMGKYIGLLTDYISQNRTKHDMWLVRGVNDNGASKFLQIPIDMLELPAEDLKSLLVGRVVRDEAFMSCGTAFGTGFSGIELNIYCPKGTQAVYAEPFSAFGGGDDGYAWDGKSEQSYFSGEFETIIQRGTSYRVIDVRNVNGKNVFDIEVIDQIEIGG